MFVDLNIVFIFKGSFVVIKYIKKMWIVFKEKYMFLVIVVWLSFLYSLLILCF